MIQTPNTLMAIIWKLLSLARNFMEETESSNICY